MDSPEDRPGETPQEGPKGGLEYPTPPFSNEKGIAVVDVEALLRSCSMKGLSPKVAERIQQADADQDGALSVDELVEVIRAEVRAVSDRKLFRNILIALFVTVLVLVATLCGTVYAIVNLSKEVKNDNGVLVSSSSGDVMATGTAQQSLTVGPELLSLLNFPSSLSRAHAVIIPAIDSGNVTMYKVAKISSSPSTGTAEVNTVDGTILFMNQSGVYEASGDSKNAYRPLFVSAGSRRRLMSDGDGSTETQGASMVMDMGYSTRGSDCNFDRSVIYCALEGGEERYGGFEMCICQYAIPPMILRGCISDDEGQDYNKKYGCSNFS